MTAGPLSGTEDVRENLIGELVARERARLEHTDDAVAAVRRQYRRPPERPFTAAERDRVTILLGGLTPYHGILEELQKRGYTIFSQTTLPRDDDLLERLFGDEVREGVIRHALDISDVWKHSTSENTNQKIWAAKFVARHPNLVALEFSSFKCGHDAPVYSVIEEIVEAAGRPYLAFKDLDENQAAGAIKLRVETIDSFLKRHRDVAMAEAQRHERLEALLV